jgi:hypothetical protein
MLVLQTTEQYMGKRVCMIFSPHIGGKLLYRTLSNNNNLQITASPVLLFFLFLKCIVFVYFLFHCFFLSGLGLFVLFTQIGTTMHCLCTYWWIILNITCIRVAYLSSVLWCPLRFPHNDDVRFVFTASCL